MKKYLTVLAVVFSTIAFAKDTKFGGVINFSECINQSKVGKEEQKNLENLRVQMMNNLEEMEKDLKVVTEQLNDPDYLDCLSTKAEEELKLKYNSINEDLNRYKAQFNQVLQYNQYQIMQKINTGIEKAAEKVAKEKKLPFVISKEACYYFSPDYEITNEIISELDLQFDLEKKEQKELSAKDSTEKQEVVQKETSKTHKPKAE